jgi:hypothetical protein
MAFVQQIFDTQLDKFVYYTKPVIDTTPSPTETSPNHTGNLLVSTHAIVGQTSARLTIREEGVDLLNEVDALNFIGVAVTATAAGNDVNIAIAGNGGEANTASNLGDGIGVYAQKIFFDLQFRSIKGVGSVTATLVGDVIELDAAASTDADNVGTGTGVYKQKDSNTLKFYSLKGDGLISVAYDGDDIAISTTAQNNDGANVGSGAGVYKEKSGSNLQLRSLVGSGGIAVNEGTNEITIDGSAIVGVVYDIVLDPLATQTGNVYNNFNDAYLAAISVSGLTRINVVSSNVTVNSGSYNLANIAICGPSQQTASTHGLIFTSTATLVGMPYLLRNAHITSNKTTALFSPGPGSYDTNTDLEGTAYLANIGSGVFIDASSSPYENLFTLYDDSSIITTGAAFIDVGTTGSVECLVADRAVLQNNGSVLFTGTSGTVVVELFGTGTHTGPLANTTSIFVKDHGHNVFDPTLWSGVTNLHHEVTPPYTISPTALAGTQTNYAPTNFFQANVLRLSATGATRTIKNFAAPSSQARTRVFKQLYNVGSQDIVISNNDTTGGGTAVLTGTGADVTISPAESATLYYDNTSSAYRLHKIAAGSALTVKDEGSSLSTSVTSIDFVGSGVTATGTNSVTVTIPSLTVKDEGSSLSTSVTSIDFVGSGVTATGTNSVTVTIPGPSLTVKDEGSSLSTSVTSIDFVGGGVTATGTNSVTVTIPGAGSITVQDEGSNLTTALSVLNFTGSGITATGTSTVTVNVPGGGLTFTSVKTGTYNAVDGDLVRADPYAALANLTINLPTATSGAYIGVKIEGPCYGYKVTVAFSGNIVTPISKTSSSWDMISDGESAYFKADGTNWHLVG